MGLPYKAVEAAFAQLHFIRDDKRTAFRARLKHLQRLGFPPGINTGTGRAADYRGHHILLLGVALEMIQLGLSPERAVNLIKSDLFPLTTCARLAIFGLHHDQKAGVEPNPMFLYFDPSALNGLSSESGEDDAQNSFFYGGTGVVAEGLREMGAKEARIALLNMTALIANLFHVLSEQSEAASDLAEAELAKWLESHPEFADVDT